MIPARIAGSTRVLGAPVGWTPETSGPCRGLPIRDEMNGDAPCMVSCRELTPAELAALVALAKACPRCHRRPPPTVEARPAEEVKQMSEREFVSRLSEALLVAYRRAGGVARIARATNGATVIRNIATLEAATIYRAALHHPATDASAGDPA